MDCRKYCYPCTDRTSMRRNWKGLPSDRSAPEIRPHTAHASGERVNPERTNGRQAEGEEEREGQQTKRRRAAEKGTEERGSERTPVRAQDRTHRGRPHADRRRAAPRRQGDRQRRRQGARSPRVRQGRESSTKSKAETAEPSSLRLVREREPQSLHVRDEGQGRTGSRRFLASIAKPHDGTLRT